MIPAPVEDYTTSRVLTMEYVRGQKVTSLHPVVQLDLAAPPFWSPLWFHPSARLIPALLLVFLVVGGIIVPIDRLPGPLYRS